MRLPKAVASLAFMVAVLPLVVLAGDGEIGAESSVGYRLSGIDGFSVVGPTIIVPEGAKPKVEPCGVVVITCTASQVTVKASNSKREPVRVESVKSDDGESRQYLILGTGTVWVDVVCIDFETQFFDISQLVLNIGEPSPPDPEPEPDNPDPPGPDPEVPDDVFDNIARRVAAKASGLPSNKAMCDAYRNASATLRNNPSVTIPEVAGSLSVVLKGIPNYQEYSGAIELINSDTAQRWPMTSAVLADYWGLVADGFKAGG